MDINNSDGHALESKGSQSGLSIVEFDLNKFSKAQLIDIILAAHYKDETFNQFFSRTLLQAAEYLEDTIDSKKP